MKQERRIGVAIFGYRRRRVRELLHEREALAQEAEVRLRAAEGRILGLHRELEVVEEELSERDARIQDLGAQVEAFARSSEAPTPKVLVRELDAILSSAEATAQAMIERTRAVTERKLQDASEYERRLYADLVRADEWRQEALPLIRAVHSRIGEIRARLEEVAESVVETVKPLEQLSDIDWPQAQQLPMPGWDTASEPEEAAVPARGRPQRREVLEPAAPRVRGYENHVRESRLDKFEQKTDADGNGHRPQPHEGGDHRAHGDGESDLIDLQRRARARASPTAL